MKKLLAKILKIFEKGKSPAGRRAALPAFLSRFPARIKYRECFDRARSELPVIIGSFILIACLITILGIYWQVSTPGREDVNKAVISDIKSVLEKDDTVLHAQSFPFQVPPKVKKEMVQGNYNLLRWIFFVVLALFASALTWVSVQLFALRHKLAQKENQYEILHLRKGEVDFEREEFAAEAQALKNELTELKVEAVKLREVNQKAIKELEDGSKNLQVLGKIRNDLSQKVVDLSSKLDAKEKEISALEKAKVVWERERKGFEKELEELDELKLVAREKDKLIKERNKQKEEAEEMGREKEGELERSRKKTENMKKTIKDMELELTGLGELREELRNKNKKLDELDKIKAELWKKTNELKDLAAVKAELNQGREELEELRGLRNTLKEKEAKIEELRRVMIDLKKEAAKKDKLQAEISTLQAMVAQGDELKKKYAHLKSELKNKTEEFGKQKALLETKRTSTGTPPAEKKIPRPKKTKIKKRPKVVIVKPKEKRGWFGFLPFGGRR